MNENSSHETYLFISEKKYIISVNKEFNQKIYLEEFGLNDASIKKPLDHLEFFLNDNIFKIEKKLNDFVKKISVILDLDIFFPIEISIKKDINNDEIDVKTLNQLAYEAKNYCKKPLEHKRIIHMFIKNYKVDNQSYSCLPINIKGKKIILDIKFITIHENFLKHIEKIFKKYQISLHKVFNSAYVEKFLSQNEMNIFSMAKKIAEGFNNNEVMLIEKSSKKQGFFEKFFNFFN